MDIIQQPAYASLNLTEEEGQYISLCVQDHLDQLKVFPPLAHLKVETLALGYIEASSFGSLRIMKYLEEFLKKRDKIDFDQEVKEKALYWAWSGQFLKIIEYLSPGETFPLACQKGNLNLLTDVVELTTLEPKVLANGYLRAAHGGHLGTMQKVEGLEKFDLSQKVIKSSIFWAGMAGRLNVLTYLVPKLIDRQVLKECIKFSIGQKQLEVSKYLLTFPVISSDEDFLKQLFCGMATQGYPKELCHFLTHTLVGQDPVLVKQVFDLTIGALRSTRERYPTEKNKRPHFHVVHLAEVAAHLSSTLDNLKRNDQNSSDQKT